MYWKYISRENGWFSKVLGWNVAIVIKLSILFQWVNYSEKVKISYDNLGDTLKW